MTTLDDSDEKGPRSISGPGVTVAGSAFNAVKIEAALAVVSALAVAGLSERLLGGAASFLVLLVYGFVAGGWIVWRSRRVLAGCASGQGGASQPKSDLAANGQE